MGYDSTLVPEMTRDREFLNQLKKLCKDMVCEINRTKPNTIACLRSLGQAETLELIHRDISMYLSKDSF